jgi:hypothetical protein
MERNCSSKLGGTGLNILISSFILFPSANAAWAQQTVQDKGAAPFMEEVTDGKSPAWHSSGSAPIKAAGQEIHTDSGATFMEEVPQKKKPKAQPLPNIDMSSVGVSVDPNGKIIPLLQPGGAPPVMPNGSRTEIDYTPRTMYVPYSTFTGPTGYVPRRTPFGTVPVPYYQPQQNGAIAVPLGVPQSFSSSSDSPDSQQANYGISGSTVTGPGVLVNPGGRSGQILLPQETQFQQQGTIRSIFPSDLNKGNN